MRLLILNESSRPGAELLDLIRFAGDPLARHAPARVAVKVVNANTRRDGYAGRAYWGRLPGWGRRQRATYAVRMSLPSDDWRGYGVARVCWHSTAAVREARARWSAGEKFDAWASQPLVESALAAGRTHVGRWPIYRVDDWHELAVHLAAHELRHVAQYANGRSRSELDCEEYAAARLIAWRAINRGDQSDDARGGDG